MPSLSGLRLSHGNVSLSDTAFLRRKKKEFESPNNVEIVRSLSHVRMPKVFQVGDLRESKQGYQSPDRIISLYSPSLDSSQDRFSKSESALDRIVIDGSGKTHEPEALGANPLTRAISSMAEQPHRTKGTQSGSPGVQQELHRTQSFESTMRTSIHLESSDESDADDDDAASIASSPTISPLSDRAPHGSGTHWRRFFPELSSHFSLVFPVNTDVEQGRVSPLDDSYHQSFAESPAKTDTRISESFSSSPDIPDGTSSCYSRRSSLSSLGSDSPASHRKAEDAYSVMSPTKAGVFDDTVSLRKRRTKSSRERLLVNDLMNKPLPEEPPIQMSPLAVRRLSSTTSFSTRRRGGSKHFAPPSAILTYDLDALDEAFQRSSPRNLPRVEKDDNSPSLIQAAKELENELAKYADRLSLIRETADILNQPLQISRGAMEMVASRPAPSPNVLQSHSQDHVSLRRNKRAERRKTNDFNPSLGSKRNKMLGKSRIHFSFSVSGFGRRINDEPSSHLRSLSSKSLESAIGDLDERIKEKPKIGVLVGRTNGTIGRRTPIASFHDSAKMATAELRNSSEHPHDARPTSTSSERLRLQLPRLQTDRLEPPKDPKRLVKSYSRSKRQSKNPHYEAEEKVLVSSDCLESPDSVFLNRTVNAVELPSATEPPRLSNIQRLSKIFELDAGLPSPALHVEEVRIPMPEDIPEEVILCIFQSVSTLGDLFGLALANKRFYQTFKRHEIDLMRNALYNMSPAAWELREMSPPWSSEWQNLTDPDAPVPVYTPKLYLQHYVKDIYTLAQVKSLLLLRCSSLLRRETVRGLAGLDIVRAIEIDDALWRIWTFCRIFGAGKGRENDIRGQVDWFNGGQQAKQRMRAPAALVTEPFSMNNVLFEPPQGFAEGNGQGLSTGQLYDMTEIWTCLGVLLQPCYGMIAEARRFGVFDGLDIKRGDTANEEAVLEEWTYYVLTLGLTAVLSISSMCPAESAEATFRKAQKLGLTKWSPLEAGTSRASFLKEAVSRAYEARARDHFQTKNEATSVSNSTSASPNSPDSHTHCSSSYSQISQQNIHGGTPQQNAPGLHSSTENERAYSPNDVPTELSPISNYTSIMNRLEEQWRQEASGFSGVTVTPDMPDMLSATDFIPVSISPPMSTIPYLPTFAEPQVYDQVLDPVDKAIHTLVHELGFTEEDAKWALKITDSGDSINADAAVNLLLRERKKRERSRRFSKLKRGSSTADSLVQPLLNAKRASNTPGWRWA